MIKLNSYDRYVEKRKRLIDDFYISGQVELIGTWSMEFIDTRMTINRAKFGIMERGISIRERNASKKCHKYNREYGRIGL